MATFVATIAFKTTKNDNKYFWKLSDCARQLQNVCLAESLSRLEQIKRTNLYKKTIKMPKTTMRSKNFNYLNKKFGFSAYDLEKFGTKTKNNSKFIGKHLGTHVCQKVSNRAFLAVQKLSFYKAKKVHFKPKGEFISLEGKNNKTFLRYSNGYALVGKRAFKCIINPKDLWLSYALNQRIKYCRLIHKTINGKDRFYIQLILEGIPFQKYKIGQGETGLDIGPSTIAVVSETQVILKEFCDELVFLDKEKRRIQRLQDRRLRVSNPANYNANGTIKKGRKVWVKSKRYMKTQVQMKEVERKLTETRKHLHGRDANLIITEAKTVKTEKLSYRAFQKIFGKSIGRRAPSAFIRLLERKLFYQGGKLIEFSTYKTKLSQTCHCGTIQKKKLSDRWHNCHCGVKAQRDIYSAFLAQHVTLKESLDYKTINEKWNQTKQLMDDEISRLREIKKTRRLNLSFGI